MAGDFGAKVDELLRRVHAPEKLTMSVVVDQVYAHYQHERMELKHPRGGMPKYLESQLYSHYRDYIQAYADHVLEDEDGGVGSLMSSAEHLSDQVEVSAPREWGDLGRSGHPSVKVGEFTERDRPPKVSRLTEVELKAKSRAILRMRLAAGLTVYFFKNGKILRIPGKNEPHELRGRL